MRIQGLTSKEHFDDVHYIRKHTPISARYEQLAEECTELAQAALKIARIIRQESPTSMTIADADGRFDEELGDVLCCIETLCVDHDKIVSNADRKTKRWCERIKNMMPSERSNYEEHFGSPYYTAKTLKKLVDCECCPAYKGCTGEIFENCENHIYEWLEGECE